MSTLSFIQNVGYNQDGSLSEMTFTYNAADSDGVVQLHSITVPFLTLIPIPFIRVRVSPVRPHPRGSTRPSPQSD